MKKGEIFTVAITPEGAKRAWPAIWYFDQERKSFKVKKAKWPLLYEVVEGQFTGKLIDYADCKKVEA